MHKSRKPFIVKDLVLVNSVLMKIHTTKPIKYTDKISFLSFLDGLWLLNEHLIANTYGLENREKQGTIENVKQIELLK